MDDRESPKPTGQTTILSDNNIRHLTSKTVREDKTVDQNLQYVAINVQNKKQNGTQLTFPSPNEQRN